MTTAATIAGAVTLAGGLGVGTLGLLTIDAGRGGYHGPIPGVKVPRDNHLILAGLLLFLVGSVVAAAGLEVLS